MWGEHWTRELPAAVVRLIDKAERRNTVLLLTTTRHNSTCTKLHTQSDISAYTATYKIVANLQTNNTLCQQFKIMKKGENLLTNLLLEKQQPT
jgi:hypothetical protein